MITKKIFPIGTVHEKKEGRFMEISKTIMEYRIFGILLYKKEISSPRLSGAEYWDEFYSNI